MIWKTLAGIVGAGLFVALNWHDPDAKTIFAGGLVTMAGYAGYFSGRAGR